MSIVYDIAKISDRAERVKSNIHIKKLTGLAQPVDWLTTTRGAVVGEGREAVAAGLWVTGRVARAGLLATEVALDAPTVEVA